MERPTTRDILLASTWLEHHGSTWAWDDLNDLIQAEPDAAWKMVQFLVAFAADFGTLAAVAAGPVEDLLSTTENFPPMRREAEENERFRICLRGAYGLPEDLQRYADEVLPIDPLPPRILAATPASDQIALMVAWFRHSDTYWATTFLDELIKHDSETAWRTVRLLLRLSDDLPERKEDVLLFAVEPFVQQHLEKFRAELLDFAQRDPELRAWVLAIKRPPRDSTDVWKCFLDDLSSA